MNDDDLVCLQWGRWHRTGYPMAYCERNARYTMMAKNLRADHAAQLRDTESGALRAVPADMRELT